MLKPGDTVLCTIVFRHLPLTEQLAIARGAGFQGVALTVMTYAQALAQGFSDRDIRRLIEDHGLTVDYLDGVVHWIPGGSDPQRAGTGASPNLDHERIFEAAASLGASLINAVEVFGFNPGLDALSDAFASLCDRAGAHGLRVSLEFTPIGAVPDLAASAAILSRGGRANAGVLLDTWHFQRAGCHMAELAALPPERYFALQLSDTKETPHTDVLEETLHHRLLPGAGTADVAGILRALQTHGVRLPYGAEVFSDELTASAPLDAAKKMMASVRSVTPR